MRCIHDVTIYWALIQPLKPSNVHLQEAFADWLKTLKVIPANSPAPQSAADAAALQAAKKQLVEKENQLARAKQELANRSALLVWLNPMVINTVLGVRPDPDEAEVALVDCLAPPNGLPLPPPSFQLPATKPAKPAESEESEEPATSAHAAPAAAPADSAAAKTAPAKQTKKRKTKEPKEPKEKAQVTLLSKPSCWGLGWAVM